ncbi:hypothetical protein [Okeania sp. SIO2B3]|uniref:hypothetical protein n=1 Tax=Okeania sp. SIO2B3 TaxID=2607784 RepID=UPI0025EDF728|nr:hypothetical protein [Okeania sp. SIO2B3]
MYIYTINEVKLRNDLNDVVSLAKAFIESLQFISYRVKAISKWFVNDSRFKLWFPI